MATKKSGSTSITDRLDKLINAVDGKLDKSDQEYKINTTLEFTTKVKGAKQGAKEIKEFDDQISSLKKNLKDGDITADLYKKSAKLNDSIKENTKALDELYTKAKTKDANLEELSVGDTKAFYNLYYTLEEQLNKMGKKIPEKYKKAFKEIQGITSGIIQGTSKQTDDYYNISLTELKKTAVARVNRNMKEINAEIKAQDRARRDAEIAELESQKERVKSKYSSGNAIENLRKLNKLGLTDEGDIDRSKIIFQNLEQCEKVIKSIKDNISKISSEDSEENLDVLESANFLLSNLEKSAEKLNNLKFFDSATSGSQKNIENLWDKKKFNEEYKIQEEDKFKELRQSVDDGILPAEEAADEYNDFCKSLIHTNEVANTTASTLKTVNKYLREGVDSNGDYKTFEDIFQMGDLNDIAVDKLYEALQNFKNLGIEGINLVSDDELDRIDRAEGLLEVLKAVQRGHVDYTADYEAHHRQQDEDFFDDYTDYEDDSAESGRREAETFDEIEESAKDAAEAKQKFVEANKEVFDSIVNTLKWLGDEDEGFRKLAENLGAALGQFGDFASSSNFSNFIEALDKIIEKIDEVANKTGKIGLNLNIKEDSSMEVQQAAKATDAYYASILKNMRNKANKLQASGLDIATLLFNSPEVSDVGKRYGSLTEAQEALKLGTIDKADRTNEENARAYLQYFEQLRIARDNVKDILEKYRNILKTGVDSQGKKISEDDKTTIKQMITDYENQWSFLLSPRALPAYTITQVAQDVNKINGVTSRGKQSTADKKRKAGNTIAEMLGLDQGDTEATNAALEQLAKTLEEIKGILLSISQKDIWGELFDDKNGRLDIISQKIEEIINKVKELNKISDTSNGGNGEPPQLPTTATTIETGLESALTEEGREDIQAYADGVAEGEAGVRQDVSEVMEAGIESGMEALDEHSPSVVYRIMGQNSIEGYILGVKDKEFELIDTVGKVLKSGFLNSEADAKWLSDWWESLVSKDTFSIEQVDLLPNSRQFATEAFNADIRGQVVEGNNLVDVLKSTALVTRDVAKANRERAQSERELSTEVERVYEGEFEEEGRRSNRNMKRTKTSNDLYEYEEEISPGRTRRFQRRRNRRTGTWVTDEIISTDYDKLVSEAVDATVKLTKAQHNLELEQAKQRPNIDLIIEYNNQIREAQERLDRATLSAASFAQETAEIVNTDDPRYDTKYVMGMFNDAVNEQSAFKLSDENIRYYSKLRNENEATQRSIDATTRALAGFESQVRAVEYSYDQSLAPGLTKPVTKKSDLDELTEARNKILGKIDDLKGHSATVEEITEIRKLISEYQLLARAKRDANNVVDKNLGGDTLEVKVSKQIANIDKLIAKSEQYGDKTEDITNKLKDQKQALQDSINVDQNTGKISTDIEAKDFYDIQSTVKILGSQLDSNIIKIKEEKKLVNEYLEAFANEQKALNQIEVLKNKGETKNKNAIVAETQKMTKAAEALHNAEDALKDLGFDFTTIEADKNNIIAEKGNIKGRYYDQVNAKAYKGLDTDLASVGKILQGEDKYIDSFTNKVKELQIELQTFIAQDFDFNDKDAIDKLNDIKQKVQEIKVEAKSDDVQLALDNTIEKTKYKIAKFINENSAMTDEYRSKLKNLEIRLDGADLTKAEVNDIVDTFIRLETEITKAGKTGKSFFSTIKDRLTGLNAQLIAQYLSFQDMIRYAREAFNVIQELNIQMVELAKVSEQSLSQIEADFNSYANTAKELGATISDTISATADWARMGYNVPDAKQLAEVALLYKNVGDGIDITAANQSLISTLQGYQMQADEAEHIVDVFNEVANNYAIDTAGIGEALQRSAASLNAANTSLEQSVALVTAANTVVQNPESVGTTFKTLSARLRGAKTDLEELGEEEDEFTQTTSKLQDLVKGLTGFDILEADQKTFKSIYDILIGIGKEWKNLTDIERASLGEALAGKRNANTLFAVLDNIETLEAAYATAEDAAGSAQREQENFEKGIEYSVNKAKAALQELAFDALDSDLLKGLIDMGTNAINLLDTIIDKFGLLKTAIVGIAGVIGSQKLG